MAAADCVLAERGRVPGRRYFRPNGAVEAIVSTGDRRRWMAYCGALCCTIGIAQALAQESERGYAAAGDQARRIAPKHGEANQRDEWGGKSQALLGGPAPPGNLYGAAGDTLTAEHGFTHPEHVARDATVNRADPGMQPAAQSSTQSPTQSAEQSALSVYHGPGDVGKAVGQVYRMPW